MKFNVITIFPDIIFHYCDESILGRAQKEELIDVNVINLRDFTMDKHKTVDDTPYGGGPGMVMKPEPIYKALQTLDKKTKKQENKKAILLSPRGAQFNQRIAEEWSKLEEITFVCGRYEGVDQRVADFMVDEEISIGPYVLAGGELGAMVIIEAVSRLIPGVLGNIESLAEETFGTTDYRLKTKDETTGRPRSIERSQSVTVDSRPSSVVQYEYPQYTKPAEFMGWRVPDVLLSGNHEEIKKWRSGLQ